MDTIYAFQTGEARHNNIITGTSDTVVTVEHNGITIIKKFLDHEMEAKGEGQDYLTNFKPIIDRMEDNDIDSQLLRKLKEGAIIMQMGSTTTQCYNSKTGEPITVEIDETLINEIGPKFNMYLGKSVGMLIGAKNTIKLTEDNFKTITNVFIEKLKIKSQLDNIYLCNAIGYSATDIDIIHDVKDSKKLRENSTFTTKYFIKKCSENFSHVFLIGRGKDGTGFKLGSKQFDPSWAKGLSKTTPVIDIGGARVIYI